jgi:hypothetical protein
MLMLSSLRLLNGFGVVTFDLSLGGVPKAALGCCGFCRDCGDGLLRLRTASPSNSSSLESGYIEGNEPFVVAPP